jgi:putative chitinase
MASAVAKVDSNTLYQNVMKYAKMAGVTTPVGLAMYLGQMHAESGGFKVVSENLNYKVDTLMKLFSRAKNAGRPAVAEVVKGGAPAIAEFLYGGRMGNNQPGDGWKYRGRGPLQITGKENYTKAGKALGLDLVGNPDLLLDPDIGARAAAWYFSTRVNANALNSGNLLKVTKAINGGTIGLDHREEAYKAFTAKVNAGTLDSISATPSGGGAASKAAAAQPDKAPPPAGTAAAVKTLTQSAKAPGTPTTAPSATQTSSATPVATAVGSAASKSPTSLPAPTTSPGTTQVAQAKQSEQQRGTASSGAVNMDAVANIMRDQLNVQMSMDAKLGNIDATLLRMEKGGSSKSATPPPQAPAAPSGRPPVSMLKA